MQSPNGIPWFDISIKVLGLVLAVIGGLWAWSKFIIEKAIIPPVDFSIDYSIKGANNKQRIVEFLLFLKNLGSSTLVAKEIKLRVLYLTKNGGIEVFTCMENIKFGRVDFKYSLSEDFSFEGNNKSKVSKFTIVKQDTFVQPGVNQIYTFVTAIPIEATYLLLKGEFQYAQRPTTIQTIILRISRYLGLINWSLQHIEKAHTIERCFRIVDKPE